MKHVHPAATRAALLALVTALAATALGATAGAASARTPAAAAAAVTAAPGQKQASLATVQSTGDTQIARRLTALQTALTAVSANRTLTAADRATLTGDLQHDLTGLTGLRATLAADTTLQQATADYRTIFRTYRVYALALPQVRYAAAGDAITYDVVPLLRKAQSALTATLAADPARSTPPVQAALTDLASQISVAAAKSDGLADRVLAFTPAQYDAQHGLLTPSRQDLADARAAIVTAKADIASVRAALQ